MKCHQYSCYYNDERLKHCHFNYKTHIIRLVQKHNTVKLLLNYCCILNEAHCP